MKKPFILLLCVAMASVLNAQNGAATKTALLVIDIQDFYFPGGRSELVNPQAAAEKAALLLADFRAKHLPVIHVRHESRLQSDIRATVKPLAGEKIIVKKEVSAFNGTDLHDGLQALGVTHLVICGMQTHMCVEGAVRAGYDLGYRITLVHDACATRDLKWGDEVVPARMVHVSTLATLKNYAQVVSTDEFLRK